VPGYGPDFFDAGIVGNPIMIIEMKGVMKSVGVNGEG
jgi:hypothetical protein